MAECTDLAVKNGLLIMITASANRDLQSQSVQIKLLYVRNLLT